MTPTLRSLIEETTLASFAEFVKSVRAELRPERFVLFGSRARGDHLTESDFDVLVVSSAFDSSSPTERVARILSLWSLDVGLDVLCLTPGEYRGEAQRAGSWVLRETARGVDLLARDGPPSAMEHPMRDETRQWWSLAEADLLAGERLADAALHHLAVFQAHQAAEKALKALWMESEGTDPPKTHELESLGRRLNAPPEVLRAARNLNPEFVVARYPSPALGNPVDRYTLDAARDRIAEARQVLEWVRSRLPGTSP